MAGDPARIPRIAAHFHDAEPVADHRGYVSWRGMLGGVRVGAVSHGIGAPSAAIVAEELARAGVRTVIRLGTAGGIAPGVRAGDLVVPVAALRHDGLTAAYLPPEYPALADPLLVTVLEGAARDLGLRVHVGLVETKDSFYGQVDRDSSPMRDALARDWKVMTEAGVLATEMECSALFVVGAVRRMRTAAIVKVMVNQNLDPHEVVEGDDDLVRAGVLGLERIILRDRRLDRGPAA